MKDKIFVTDETREAFGYLDLLLEKLKKDIPTEIFDVIFDKHFFKILEKSRQRVFEHDKNPTAAMRRVLEIARKMLEEKGKSSFISGFYKRPSFISEHTLTDIKRVRYCIRSICKNTPGYNYCPSSAYSDRDKKILAYFYKQGNTGFAEGLLELKSLNQERLFFEKKTPKHYNRANFHGLRMSYELDVIGSIFSTCKELIVYIDMGLCKYFKEDSTVIDLSPSNMKGFYESLKNFKFYAWILNECFNVNESGESSEDNKILQKEHLQRFPDPLYRSHYIEFVGRLEDFIERITFLTKFFKREDSMEEESSTKSFPEILKKYNKRLHYLRYSEKKFDQFDARKSYILNAIKLEEIESDVTDIRYFFDNDNRNPHHFVGKALFACNSFMRNYALNSFRVTSASRRNLAKVNDYFYIILMSEKLQEAFKKTEGELFIKALKPVIMREFYNNSTMEVALEPSNYFLGNVDRIQGFLNVEYYGFDMKWAKS